MPDTPSNGRSEAWLALRACLQQLLQGPWRFIRLRGGDLGEEAIDGDDVDLLGSRESATALLDAALAWVRAGQCHLRVRTTHRSKISLSLLATDGRHRLDLDLWIDLRQIDHRRRSLTYQDCRAAVLNPDAAIQRLPAPLEACIFLHHLQAKRKKLTDPKQLARLSAYAAELRTHGPAPLAQSIEATAATAQVSEETAALALRLLEEALPVARPGRCVRLFGSLQTAWSRAWFSPPAAPRMLTIMGCDGCGKTSLSRRLAADRPDIHSVYTGKHLYRKWLGYKLLVIFVRPLLCQGRETFDDTFAPLVYLLACLRLQLKLLLPRRGLVLIDRSLMDFLLLARKTDAPRFSSCRWLAGLFGTRLPHVHLIVPFPCLQARKLEMTRAGHACYDTLMFHYLSRRIPTDYTVFDNRGTEETSAGALGRILDWINE